MSEVKHIVKNCIKQHGRYDSRIYRYHFQFFFFYRGERENVKTDCVQIPSIYSSSIQAQEIETKMNRQNINHWLIWLIPFILISNLSSALSPDFFAKYSFQGDPSKNLTNAQNEMIHLNSKKGISTALNSGLVQLSVPQTNCVSATTFAFYLVIVVKANLIQQKFHFHRLPEQLITQFLKRSV